MDLCACVCEEQAYMSKRSSCCPGLCKFVRKISSKCSRQSWLVPPPSLSLPPSPIHSLAHSYLSLSFAPSWSLSHPPFLSLRLNLFLTHTQLSLLSIPPPLFSLLLSMSSLLLSRTFFFPPSPSHLYITCYLSHSRALFISLALSLTLFLLLSLSLTLNLTSLPLPCSLALLSLPLWVSISPSFLSWFLVRLPVGSSCMLSLSLLSCSFSLSSLALSLTCFFSPSPSHLYITCYLSLSLSLCPPPLSLSLPCSLTLFSLLLVLTLALSLSRSLSLSLSLSLSRSISLISLNSSTRPLSLSHSLSRTVFSCTHAPLYVTICYTYVETCLFRVPQKTR